MISEYYYKIALKFIYSKTPYILTRFVHFHYSFGNWDDVRKLAADAASHISDVTVYNKV